MPRELPFGAYDDLIDVALQQAIERLPPEREADVGDIEGAEQPRYLADVVRAHVQRALASVKGDDDERTLRRRAIVNGVLRHLATELAADSGDNVVDAEEVSIAAG